MANMKRRLGIIKSGENSDRHYQQYAESLRMLVDIYDEACWLRWASAAMTMHDVDAACIFYNESMAVLRETKITRLNASAVDRAWTELTDMRREVEWMSYLAIE